MKTLIVIGYLLYTCQPLIAQEDKDAFYTYCGNCHTIGNGQLVGPDLKGVHNKYDTAQLLLWVRASKVVQLSDTDRIILQPFFANRSMPDFQYMQEQDILAIVNYIKKASEFNWIGPIPDNDQLKSIKDSTIHKHFKQWHKKKEAEKIKKENNIKFFWSIYWLFFTF